MQLSDSSAYNSSSYPGDSALQKKNLQNYQAAYDAAAKKYRDLGYKVVGKNYFKKIRDTSRPDGFRYEKVGKLPIGYDNDALKGSRTTQLGKAEEQDKERLVQVGNVKVKPEFFPAELKYQRSKSPFADLRGGGGVLKDGKRAVDPRVKIKKNEGDGEEPIITVDDKETIEEIQELDTPTRDSEGTQTSPNTGKLPMSWADYSAWLTEQGLQQRKGTQSNALPGLATSRFGNQNVDFSNEAVAEAANDAFRSAIDGKGVEGLNGLTPLDGAQYGKGLDTDEAMQYFNIGVEQAGGAQKGSSNSPDKGDQSRALTIGANGTVFGGDDEGSTLATRGSGLSARARAFLDAPDGSPLKQMQAADAAIGLYRQGDEYAVDTGNGEFQKITKEGANEARSNYRDGQAYKDEFLNRVGIATPGQAQSPDAIQPVQATFTPTEQRIVETDLRSALIPTEGEFGDVMDSELYSKTKSYPSFSDTEALFNFENAEDLVDVVAGKDRAPLMREEMLSRFKF